MHLEGGIKGPELLKNKPEEKKMMSVAGEYKYKIAHINREEHWITIISNSSLDTEDPNSFYELINLILMDLGGDVQEIGDMEYIITNDSCRLIYQWDGCFGISVIYPQNISEDEAVDFLSRYVCIN